MLKTYLVVEKGFLRDEHKNEISYVVMNHSQGAKNDVGKVIFSCLIKLMIPINKLTTNRLLYCLSWRLIVKPAQLFS